VKYQTGAMCSGVLSGSAERRLERVGRDEVVVFEEVAAHFRREEDDGAEHHQEHRHTDDVVHRVIRVEGDAVQRDVGSRHP